MQLDKYIHNKKLTAEKISKKYKILHPKLTKVINIFLFAEKY